MVLCVISRAQAILNQSSFFLKQIGLTTVCLDNLSSCHRSCFERPHCWSSSKLKTVGKAVLKHHVSVRLSDSQCRRSSAGVRLCEFTRVELPETDCDLCKPRTLCRPQKRSQRLRCGCAGKHPSLFVLLLGFALFLQAVGHIW